MLSLINEQPVYLLPSAREGLQPYKHLPPGIVTAVKNSMSQQDGSQQTLSWTGMSEGLVKYQRTISVVRFLANVILYQHQYCLLHFLTNTLSSICQLALLVGTTWDFVCILHQDLKSLDVRAEKGPYTNAST